MTRTQNTVIPGREATGRSEKMVLRGQPGAFLEEDRPRDSRKVPTVCHAGDSLSEDRVRVEVGTGTASEEGGLRAHFQGAVLW